MIAPTHEVTTLFRRTVQRFFLSQMATDVLRNDRFYCGQGLLQRHTCNTPPFFQTSVNRAALSPNTHDLKMGRHVTNLLTGLFF